MKKKWQIDIILAFCLLTCGCATRVPYYQNWKLDFYQSSKDCSQIYKEDYIYSVTYYGFHPYNWGYME